MKNNKIFKGVLSICLVASIGATAYSIKKNNDEQKTRSENREKVIAMVMEKTFDENKEYHYVQEDNENLQEEQSITKKEYLQLIGVSEDITPIELFKVISGYEVPVLNNIPEVHEYFALHKDNDSYAYSIEDNLIWHLKKGYPMAEGIAVDSIDDVLNYFEIKTADESLTR